MSPHRTDASLYLVVLAYSVFSIGGGALWLVACLHGWAPWWVFIWWCTSPALILALVLCLIFTSPTRRNK